MNPLLSLFNDADGNVSICLKATVEGQILAVIRRHVGESAHMQPSLYDIMMTSQLVEVWLRSGMPWICKFLSEMLAVNREFRLMIQEDTVRVCPSSYKENAEPLHDEKPAAEALADVISRILLLCDAHTIGLFELRSFPGVMELFLPLAEKHKSLADFLIDTRSSHLVLARENTSSSLLVRQKEDWVARGNGRRLAMFCWRKSLACLNGRV